MMALVSILACVPLFSQQLHPVPDEDEERMKIVLNSLDWLGTPYEFAGLSKDGVDCSGFVFSVLRMSGYDSVPRTSRGLFSYGIPVSGTPEPGDIVFFSESEEPTHTGIYIGEGLLIHAASQGNTTGVIISSLSEEWFKSRYLLARTVLGVKEK